ncbi:hypothetical protein F5890DRAFT_1418913 [Lentinula detonsa]|uniref:F-box domain-containing protein n=1 Tax=Lentinula detonsa TaxID=2804962 RepID=A0AA38UR05_9AGAR|nr:hypothetical protein F5890DRAFT_1418913 [Lentinula detonsa]
MHSSPVSRQSPIHSLPVELLSHIFLLGAHSLPDTLEEDTTSQELPLFNTDSVKTPLIYSAVCRHWRTVAHGTAALWTCICITIGSMQVAGPQKKHLNLSHITSYLSLSRKYPLNILLDARDPDWDFAEPEIPASSDFSDYVPPFTADDIRTIFSLLLPHLSRWQSIDVLTDTWAPMHTALCILDGPLMNKGAPLLQSLTLMRCNDYISHSPIFQPSNMKSPGLFSSFNYLEPNHLNLFPQLRILTLRGVHVAWSSLALSHPSLTSLELSSHCSNIRPTQSEFRGLLNSCPKLRSLIVNGSGFVSDGEDLSLKTGIRNINKNVKPVLLLLLEELKIGYRSALEGCDILDIIYAPNTRHLSLEDATHPGEVDQVEADRLLLFIAGLHPSSISALKPAPLFPAIQKIVLKGVRAHTDTFRKLLLSIPHLQSLELYQIPTLMDVICAMLPIPTIHVSTKTTYQRLLSSRSASPGSSLTSFSPSSPCPRLQEFCIRAMNISQEDLRFIAKEWISGRSETGAGNLKRLDIHLFDSTAPAPADIEGVRIFQVPLDIEEEGDVALAHNTPEAQLDAEFQYGGMFNDPIFDAQYSPPMSSH